MGRAMLSKSLTQFSVDGWGCVPSLWFGLRPNYGKGNGSNGNLLQNDLWHMAPRTVLFSAPDPTAGPAGESWTLTGKYGSVSCGVTAPFSWVLVHTRFCVCPPRVYFWQSVSSGSSTVGLLVTSSKRAYAIPKSAAPRSPAADHC